MKEKIAFLKKQVKRLAFFLTRPPVYAIINAESYLKSYPKEKK